MSDGQFLLIGLLVLVLIFFPAMRRTALHAFVASVIYQIVRSLWRGR